MAKSDDPRQENREATPTDMPLHSKKDSAGRGFVPGDFGEFLTDFAAQLAAIHDLNRFRSFVAQSARTLVAADGAALYVETRPLSLDDEPQQLSLPLRVGDDVQGVLVVERRKPQLEPVALDSTPWFNQEEKHYLTLLANIAAVALSGIKREQAVRQRAKWRHRALGLLQETVRAMGSTLELVPLMRRIIDATVRALHADGGILALFDAEGDLVLRAAGGVIPRDLVGTKLDLQGSLVGWVARHRRSALVSDPSADPRVSPDHLAAQTESAVRAMLAAPLVTKGQTIGVVEVTNQRDSLFDQQDLHLLEVLALSAAAAIENARLYERLFRQALAQENIVRVSQAMSSADDVDTILQKVVDSAISAIPAAFTASVHLVDKDKGELRLHSYAGRPLWDTRDTPFPVGEGIAGHVFATGQLVNVRDVLDSPRYIPGPGRVVYRSLLVTPLIVRDEPLGTLSINGLEPNAFSPDDEKMMRALAAQTEVALRDAQLLDSLRDSEGRYRNLVENVHALLITADPSGAITFARGHWLEMLGYRPDEVVGLSFQHFCHPQDWPTLAEHAAKLSAQPSKASNLRYRVLHKDGTVRWHQTNAISTADSEGRVDCIHAVIHDVTAQVEAEHSIARHADQLAALNTIASFISRSLDIDDIVQEGLQKLLDVLDLDAAGLALLDADQESLTPKKIIGLTNEFIEFVVPLQLLKGALSPGTEQSIVIPDLLADPRINRYPGLREMIQREGIRTLAATPVSAKDEQIGVLFIAARSTDAIPVGALDVLMALGQQFGVALHNAGLFAQSELRATELEAAYRQLHGLAHRKNQFVQNTSHELRTPLTLVQGYLELLLEGDFGPLSDDQHHVLGIMSAKSAQLIDLINDIASLTEIELTPEDIEAVNLTDLVLFCVAAHRDRCSQAGIVIEADQPTTATTIMGDRHRLMQAFNHLLDNAIKFSPSGGRITVKTWYEQDHAFVQVTDQGIGIPWGEQEHIFERFYQINGSVTRRYGGTGLGLAIVKETIEAHGGTVRVQSSGQEGEGTIFTVILPIVKSDNTAQPVEGVSDDQLA